MKLTVAVAALALAQGAWAQAAPQAAAPAPAAADAPPTPQARAEAARIIEAAQAADLFEDVSTGNVPAARHRRSGAVCSFEPREAGNRITIFPGTLPRGEDVGCTTTMAGVINSLYVTRIPEELTAQAYMAQAVAQIRMRYPDAKPFRGKSADMFVQSKGGVNLPQVYRARLDITDNGRKLMTKVQTARVGPWLVKMRTTGPTEPEMVTDLVSEVSFSTVLGRITGVLGGPG